MTHASRRLAAALAGFALTAMIGIAGCSDDGAQVGNTGSGSGTGSGTGSASEPTTAPSP
jgi:hypothetical protein